MEEELLRQILREIQSQPAPAWLDALQLIIPALVGLAGGLSGAAVGFYAVRRSTKSQLDALRLTTEADFEKISLERRLEWRRERYLELVNSLAEIIAAWNNTVEAKILHAMATFRHDQSNISRYGTIYTSCWDELESVRSSGRLIEARLKIGDREIGDLVEQLAKDAAREYKAMIDFGTQAIVEFGKSATEPSWPKDHDAQRADIAKRTHQISELIEQRISLTN